MNLTQALQIIFCFSSDIQERTRCEHIIANNTAIIERVTPEYGVSPVLIASICAKESRLGIDPRAASICGTKIHHVYVSDPESSIRITANTMRHRACRSLPLSLCHEHRSEVRRIASWSSTKSTRSSTSDW